MVGGRPESVEELKDMARRHWKKHRPTLYRDLKESGELEDSVQVAAQNTWEAMQGIEEQLIQENGYTPQQAKDTAWEMMREEWILRGGHAEVGGEPTGERRPHGHLEHGEPTEVNRNHRITEAEWICEGRLEMKEGPQ